MYMTDIGEHVINLPSITTYSPAAIASSPSVDHARQDLEDGFVCKSSISEFMLGTESITHQSAVSRDIQSAGVFPVTLDG